MQQAPPSDSHSPSHGSDTAIEPAVAGHAGAMSVVVIGQIGRDMVLRTDGLPKPNGSTPVLERRELLGGKGANQAVALTQLGVRTALIGVVGQDIEGAAVLRQAGRDRIDVGCVVRRGRTALLVDLVDADGTRRLFEDVPDESLVTLDDLDRCGTLFQPAGVVSIQLQQPPQTTLAAARHARRMGARVVADGLPDAAVRDDLLASVDVLRADAEEAALLAGGELRSVDDAVAVARRLSLAGPRWVALAVPGVGDVLVWEQDATVFPHADVHVVDRTGAGDAFVAGLVAGVHRGVGPRAAGELAAAAAASQVQHLGGRPHLAELSG